MMDLTQWHLRIHKVYKVVGLGLGISGLLSLAGCGSSVSTRTTDVEQQASGGTIEQAKADPNVPQYVKDKYLGGSNQTTSATNPPPATG